MIKKNEAERRKDLHICRFCKMPCVQKPNGNYYILCDRHRALGKARSAKYRAKATMDYCRQCGAVLLPTEDICSKCGRDINLDIDWSK